MKAFFLECNQASLVWQLTYVDSCCLFTFVSSGNGGLIDLTKGATIFIDTDVGMVSNWFGGARRLRWWSDGLVALHYQPLAIWQYVAHI